jgi:hypothetical protein
MNSLISRRLFFSGISSAAALAACSGGNSVFPGGSVLPNGTTSAGSNFFRLITSTNLGTTAAGWRALESVSSPPATSTSSPSPSPTSSTASCPAPGIVLGNEDSDYLESLFMTANLNTDGSTTFRAPDNSVTYFTMDPVTATGGSSPSITYTFYFGKTKAAYSIPLTVPAAGTTVNYGYASVTISKDCAATVSTKASDGSTLSYTCQAYTDGSMGLLDQSGTEFVRYSASAVQAFAAPIMPKSTSTSDVAALNVHTEVDTYYNLCWCLIILTGAGIAAAIAALWQAMAAAEAAEAAIAALEASLARAQAAIAAGSCEGPALAAWQSVVRTVPGQIAALKAKLGAATAAVAAAWAAIGKAAGTVGEETSACIVYITTGKLTPNLPPAPPKMAQVAVAPDGSQIGNAVNVTGPGSSWYFPVS